MAQIFSPKDKIFIEEAIRLASCGRGFVSPNPMVGAVIVANGHIVGTGFHQRYGGNHAEVDALKMAGDLAAGATLYCTLEPCSHFGKTPPCVESIRTAGIKKVVIGNIDPNPLVRGRGIKRLQKYGITVKSGLSAEACCDLNESYFKFITTNLPHITLKIAQSIDGKIADSQRKSSWISNKQARKIVHKWRWHSDAVLVGIGTVLYDDPELTVRHVSGPQPYRIILDSHLRIPLTSKVLKDQFVEKTVIMVSEKTADLSTKKKEIETLGAQVWSVNPSQSGRLDLRQALEKIAKEGISEVLVEGGMNIFSAFIKEELADRLACFISPMLLGDGIPAFDRLQINQLSNALILEKPHWQILDDNALITGRIKYSQN